MPVNEPTQASRMHLLTVKRRKRGQRRDKKMKKNSLAPWMSRFQMHLRIDLHFSATYFETYVINIFCP